MTKYRVSNICFLAYGAKGAGGVQSLILTLIEEMNEQFLKPKIFGSKNCFVYKRLKEKNLIFDFFELKENKAVLSKHIDENDVLIISSHISNDNLGYFKKANPYILFWCLHPRGLAVMNKISFINLKKQTNTIINYLNSNNSLILMDDLGLIQAEKTELIHKCLLFPVPIKVPVINNYIKSTTRQKKVINVTYAGRAVNWKIYPAKKIIEDLGEIDNKVFVFHIITQDSTIWKRFLSSTNLADNVHIKYHTNLYGNPYQEFLKNNSDLHFSMGTAALDGAKHGVPTILMDYSYNEIVNYKYEWLFLTKNNRLGELYDKNNLKRLSIHELIKEYNGDKLNLSRLCYEYCKKNHDVTVILDRLIKRRGVVTGKLNYFLKNTLYNNMFMGKILKIKSCFKK